jgi:uroporphyrinogen-III decarboxylase
MLIPPYLYTEKIMPDLVSFGKEIHKSGKYMCSHTDGEMDGFLDLYLETGFDIAEAFTPPPMTKASLSDAYKVWDDKITIWGGIASCMLSEQTREDHFFEHTEEIKSETAGRGFLAGIGDNAPTDTVLERLEALREMFS